MGTHKTKIGRTDYSISGGKTYIAGSNYSIAEGKTLIGGANYSISFYKPPTFTLLGSGNVMNTNPGINASFTVPSNIKMIVARLKLRSDLDSGGYADSLAIYRNGTWQYGSYNPYITISISGTTASCVIKSRYSSNYYSTYYIYAISSKFLTWHDGWEGAAKDNMDRLFAYPNTFIAVVGNIKFGAANYGFEQFTDYRYGLYLCPATTWGQISYGSIWNNLPYNGMVGGRAGDQPFAYYESTSYGGSYNGYINFLNPDDDSPATCSYSALY